MRLFDAFASSEWHSLGLRETVICLILHGSFEPPRPGGDDSEVLVMQTPGAQTGQRVDQLVVSVKGEEMRKIPGQQVRAIYCYGAVQVTAQAAETCLELGIDISYFSPAGRFHGYPHATRTLPTRLTHVNVG